AAVLVGVANRDAEPRRQQLGDGRLAGPGRTDHHDHRTDRGHRKRRWSRYERTLRLVSPTESPPNFSVIASATTRATIASATMPAAGTAHTSDRWWWARASSPVSTSTVRRARGTV